MNSVFSLARCLKHRLDLATHPWGRNSTRQLSKMKDTHRGKRCFIIGNGPSLRQTDMSKLQDEYTFGMNRIYLMFPDLGFHTTYFVSVNHLVIKQCAQEILHLEIPKFLPWGSRRDMPEATPDTIFLNTSCPGRGFCEDVRRPIWIGATVTFVALQLAYHMGFEQVILIGVDHSFASQGPAGQAVTSQGDDPNHFAPNYFGKGFRWELPDLQTSEFAYRLAREAFEKDSRQVLDATVGGKLTIFPKVDYNALF
jgi:hypothetical protein